MWWGRLIVMGTVMATVAAPRATADNLEAYPPELRTAGELSYLPVSRDNLLSDNTLVQTAKAPAQNATAPEGRAATQNLAAAASNGVAQVFNTGLPETPPHETVVVHGAFGCGVTQPDGSRTLSFACLNRQLTDYNESEPQVPALRAVDAAGRGNPEKLGTFSYSATAIRMGANFGKSVKPQRPVTPPPVHTLSSGGKP